MCRGSVRARAVGGCGRARGGGVAGAHARVPAGTAPRARCWRRWACSRRRSSTANTRRGRWVRAAGGPGQSRSRSRPRSLWPVSLLTPVLGNRVRSPAPPRGSWRLGVSRRSVGPRRGSLAPNPCRRRCGARAVRDARSAVAAIACASSPSLCVAAAAACDSRFSLAAVPAQRVRVPRDRAVPLAGQAVRPGRHFPRPRQVGFKFARFVSQRRPAPASPLRCAVSEACGQERGDASSVRWRQEIWEGSVLGRESAWVVNFGWVIARAEVSGKAVCCLCPFGNRGSDGSLCRAAR